jgi:hypothetical protein
VRRNGYSRSSAPTDTSYGQRSGYYGLSNGGHGSAWILCAVQWISLGIEPLIPSLAISSPLPLRHQLATRPVPLQGKAAIIERSDRGMDGWAAGASDTKYASLPPEHGNVARGYFAERLMHRDRALS